MEWKWKNLHMFFFDLQLDLWYFLFIALTSIFYLFILKSVNTWYLKYKCSLLVGCCRTWSTNKSIHIFCREREREIMFNVLNQRHECTSVECGTNSKLLNTPKHRKPVPTKQVTNPLTLKKKKKKKAIDPTTATAINTRTLPKPNKRKLKKEKLKELWSSEFRLS